MRGDRICTPVLRYEVHRFPECATKLGRERKGAYSEYVPGKEPEKDMNIALLVSIGKGITYKLG